MDRTLPGANNRTLVHATCVAVDGHGVLLLGPSGAGKSDLALRLVGGALRDRGRAVAATLVADDQVSIEVREGRLFGSPPGVIAGRLEVRGLGIVEMDHAGETEICMAAELVAPASIERMPQPLPPHVLLGVPLPLIRLAPFEPSAPQKLLLAVMRTVAGN